MASIFSVNPAITTFTLLCNLLPIIHSLPANQTINPINGTETSGDTRIVGGLIVTNRTEFAYQVSLRWGTTPFCGASLIDAQHLLSACHCVLDEGKVLPASSITAVLGDLSVAYTSPTTIRRPVRYIFTHANYNPKTIQNDIAVLRIDPVHFTLTVNAIPMALVAPSSGSCVVSGWGATWEEGPQSADLRYVVISMMSTSTCKAYYYGSNIKSGMICAGSITEMKDSCQGDSGGPLVCNGSLVGIVSWGEGCARYIPGVYTDVAYYSNWIETQMKRSSAASVWINVYLLLSLCSYLLV